MGQSHVSPIQSQGIEIPNLVLDDYCDQHQIDCRDFAKMDIEGHELPALQGWQKNLSDHRVKAVYVEIIPENQKGTAERQTILLPTKNHLDTRSFCAKILILDYLGSIRERIG